MPETCFRFGRFELDVAGGTILENGRPISIGGKAFALLRALLRARGQVVLKSDLMDVAWPDTYVEESNLAVQVSSLRKRLGKSPTGQDWIVTFPRQGYRFAGPFQVVQHPKSKGTRSLQQSNLEAYDYFVRGRELIMQSPAGNALARSLLIKAIELDPMFAETYAFLGHAYFSEGLHYRDNTSENRARGLEFAQKAVSLEPENPRTLAGLAYIWLYEGRLDDAEDAFTTAHRLDPDDANILTNLSGLRVLQGWISDAIECVESALRLNAFPPGWYYWDVGFAYYSAGQYEKAVEMLKNKGIGRLPARRILAASLAQLGRIEEAQAEASEFLKWNPGFRASSWAKTQPFVFNCDREHFVDGYVRAGLPA